MPTRQAGSLVKSLKLGQNKGMSRRRIEDSDREAIARFIEEHWHSRLVMSRGKRYFPHEHEGFVEWREGRIAGLLTMAYEDDALQVLTLNSTLEGERIGSALMLQAIDDARARGITRIWLTTTNDNLRAFGFYQRLGFRLVQVNVGVVDEARKVKPQIPEVGHNGIPIHDEIVFELRIEAYHEQAVAAE
jgi:GNAT superfamily N-acetyltransferase